MNNILECDDGSNKIIKLPETVWGECYAKSLDLPRWKAFQRACMKMRTDPTVNSEVWILLLTLCDSQGTLLFQESDYDALCKKNPVVISILANHVGSQFQVWNQIEKKEEN